MSEENIELLRQAWASFVDRDAAGLDYLHPDVEFEVGPEFLPDGGVFRGHEGFRDVVARWAGPWGDYRQEPQEFIDLGGDRAIVVSRTSVRSQDTGIEFDSEMAYLYTLVEGKIRRIQMARDRAAALRLAAESAG